MLFDYSYKLCMWLHLIKIKSSLLYRINQYETDHHHEAEGGSSTEQKSLSFILRDWKPYLKISLEGSCHGQLTFYMSKSSFF